VQLAASASGRVQAELEGFTLGAPSP
jgi:hypothetical protein